MIHCQTFSSIGKSTELSGSFSFQGQTHLLGKLKGDISIYVAKLVLEIGSVTEANIQCADLDIYGDFTGEIKSTGNVVLYPTSIVHGKILAKSLEVLPGAVVNINGHTGDI